MVKLTKKILLEALGVPEGILKSAESIYSKLIKFISEEGNNNIEDENYYFKLDGPFKINEYKIKSIELKLSFATADYVDEITLIGMSFSNTVILDDATLTLVSIKNKDNLEMSINMVIPNTITTFSDFYKFLKDNDKLIISSLSHELKHSYDIVKKPSGSIRDRAKYSAYTSLGFGIKPIDQFIFYLYYTTVIESLVRPTEVMSLLKQNKVKRKNFIDFLLNDDTYNTLKKINNFSLDKLKMELSQEIPAINEVLKKLREKGRYRTDEEKIDRILYLTYTNLSNDMGRTFLSGLIKNSIEARFGFMDERKPIMMNDFIKEITKFNDNPNGFFEYEEKRFKFVSNKMMKKLSKLYAMLPEDKKSIKNWDLHQKITKRAPIESVSIFKKD
jgi:hypothetical protein